MRLQERVDERTRIAQELHDTLLQGLLSASLQLELANSDINQDHPAKSQTTAVFRMLRQLIEEGRNTLRGLRSPRRSSTGNLGEAFAKIPEDLMASGAKFNVLVEGEPRPVRPLVLDEVYRIGREALANAFRHSGGSVIELVLEYTPRYFRLVIRDDGKGIPSDVMDAGRAGHWGLSGIRERASRVRGNLKISSATNAGTEIDLVVPASFAYEFSTIPRWRSWLASLYSRGANQ
jgi:signal transduction histidine kinase